MAQKILRTPNTLELSLANIDAQSVTVDWSAHEDSDPHECVGVPLCYERDYEIVLPAPTYQDASEYAADILDEAAEKIADRTPYRPLPETLADELNQADAYHEWADSFTPMMNFVWPVRLAYEVSAATAAQMMHEYASVCTLVSFTDSDKIGEEYGIALAGGGMNLADELAIAYLCCGCVPPSYLLLSLPGVIDSYKLKYAGPALRKAYARARTHYRNKVGDLRETATRIFAKAKA